MHNCMASLGGHLFVHPKGSKVLTSTILLQRAVPWLIESTVTYLDVRRLTSEEIQLRKEVHGTKQPSEYQLQAEFCSKAASLYKKLPPQTARRYRVMAEAFGPGRGKRPHLDLLISNGKMLRLGQELLIAATQSEFDLHYGRAVTYAKHHGCVIWCLDFSLSSFDTGRALVLPQPTNQEIQILCWIWRQATHLFRRFFYIWLISPGWWVVEARGTCRMMTG